jgi:glutaminyl-peptide cyclotransferase
VSVRRSQPHPGGAFTQGLALAFGGLWESVGLYGSSCLRRLRTTDCGIEWSAPLPDRLFGEGILPSATGIWQLTWREGVAVHWNVRTGEIDAKIPYESEGWGACGSPLGAMTTDGSNRITVREIDTLRPRHVLEVVWDGYPVHGLNDLEWASERLWANIYGIDYFVGIDPEDGSVSDVVDASVLRSATTSSPESVLNGIAYVPESGGFYVTGKRWPTLFDVRFEPAATDVLATFDRAVKAGTGLPGGRTPRTSRRAS